MTGQLVTDYVWEFVPFIPRLKQGVFGIQNATAITEQLKTIVQQHESRGWEYVRLEQVNVVHAAGCLASLFGRDDAAVAYDIIVFRAPRSFAVAAAQSSDESRGAPRPLAGTPARKAKERVPKIARADAHEEQGEIYDPRALAEATDAVRRAAGTDDDVLDAASEAVSGRLGRGVLQDACPECGLAFNSEDYRQDAPTWLCGKCGANLKSD